MTILITGAAGFIGMHVADRLMAQGHAVVGVDNMNDYYPVSLKQARLAMLQAAHGKLFTFHELDFADLDALHGALADQTIEAIVHLGAQAGVRYSLVNPHAYVRSNLAGHVNMLELARERRVRHFVYASSSSVYGGNDSLPFRVEDRADHPVSLYAATKRANELMSETYAHLFRLPQTGLRFFTVYGPWGRPDMAPWMFAEAILSGRPITLYDGGRLKRDFTFVEDIAAGVVGCLDHPAPAEAPRLLNIGNHRSVEVRRFVSVLEAALGRQAIVVDTPRPATDVQETFADIDAIRALCGYEPRTPIEVGIPRFAEWFLSWRKGGLTAPLAPHKSPPRR